jgi:hypothetical protein
LPFQCYDVSQVANLTTVTSAYKYRAAFKEEQMYNEVPMISICNEVVKELFVTKPRYNWKEFTFPQEELQEVPPTSSYHSYLSQSDQVAHLI